MRELTPCARFKAARFDELDGLAMVGAPPGHLARLSRRPPCASVSAPVTPTGVPAVSDVKQPFARRMRIYWTSYHYSTPRLSDDDRLTAYLYPGQVRRAYLHGLAGAAVVSVLRLMALGFLLVIALDDAGDALPWWILLPVWWVILSFGLSTASFSLYAVRTLAFWESHILTSRGYERDERRRVSATTIPAANGEVSTGAWIIGVATACVLVVVGFAM